MAEEFRTFKKFIDPAPANDLAALLGEHGFEYDVEENMPPPVGIMPAVGFTKEYLVKLRQADFEKAQELMEQVSDQETDNAKAGHYLFDFTDAELMDIVAKPDEWNDYDVVLAKKILKKRGKELKKEQIQAIKQKRIEELSKPESSQGQWILLGYVLAFLGGPLGIFIGWHLSTFKKALPNGDKKYAYT